MTTPCPLCSSPYTHPYCTEVRCPCGADRHIAYEFPVGDSIPTILDQPACACGVALPEADAERLVMAELAEQYADGLQDVASGLVW